MLGIPIASNHYTLEDSSASIKLVFPSRKNWLVIFIYVSTFIYLAVQQLLWVINRPTQPTTSIPEGYSGIVFMIMLFFVGIMAIEALELLWQLVGKEVVEIGEECIIVRHHILGLGISKQYPANTIACVFVSRRGNKGWTWYFERRLRFFDFKSGRIGFSAGNKAWRFGASLEKTEAEQIVGEIHRRFPHYRIRKDDL